MFVLRTGLQGNGKTLNTIKEVDIKAAKQNRTVFYHNIRGFNPNFEGLKATWVAFDDPHKWFELPENAMIVIDEAQQFFRIRNQASAVPAYASALETMRHQGHELHCITQNPSLIDHHFRKLCNSHIHYVRGGKGKVIKRWEFEKVNMTVESSKKDFSADGEATRILLDPKYYGAYESVKEGATHHMRFNPPRALFVLVGAVLVVSFLGYRFYERRLAPPSPEPVAESAPVAPVYSSPAAAPVVDDIGGPITVEQYVDARVPRLADVPSSAPIYDELTRPVTYPKLSCVSSSNEDFVRRNADRMVTGIRQGQIYGCRCNTQQGTRAVVSFDACMAYVTDGAFDPAKPDRQYSPAGVTGPSEARAGTGAPVGRSLTVVADSEYPSRPWR
ncbi:zonular occludens toxin [Stutzerimonas stutzeri]|nr:zonular occludens toxin [Stutzerimonas stutzeri]AWM57948.1 zonular occludens toxin [Stutzerimonas stutzeri]AWM57955.1 zonular occludens toxin [Stutzerimonas stutzeri]AWM61774.1 zonular occludens toxin [Stutzerimonas stutzeri]AWM61781.1 zonular occludens toxin [Stutzerimonas stutzeri]